MSINKDTTAILFDLDGTILDTLTDLHLSVNHALNMAGLPERTVQEVRAFVGNGAKKLIERAIGKNATDKQLETVYNYFIAHYGEHSADHTVPYYGVVEAITSLKSNGYKVGVVTNKPHKDATALIAKHFGNLFGVVLGQQADIPAKPNRQMMDKALAELNAKNVVYVGDSEVDVQFAHNAKTALVAVSWGFRSKAQLAQAGATIICDNASDMLQAILENKMA